MSAQHLQRGPKPPLIVSEVRSGTATVSADLSQYVQLTEREWRWLVDVAGPNVLAEMQTQERAA